MASSAAAPPTAVPATEAVAPPSPEPRDSVSVNEGGDASSAQAGAAVGSTIIVGAPELEEEYSDLNFAQVARDEGRRCLLMCVAFAIAIAHLYIYPALFGVRIVDQAEVPADSSKCGSSGTSSSAYRIPRGNVRPRG